MTINHNNSREGPGFKRMLARMGPEKFEALRQDTLRMQREALANVDVSRPLTGNFPHDIVRDVIKGKRS